ncbi:MAG TPA: DUF255 domain-containing protein [Chitinophagales bacterium]|nr:DUF255 domain-containing protein [Chitinophagales bacterium]
MNKSLFALLLLFGLTTQAQDKVQFIDNNWEKARAEAKKSNKYLFVDAYTDWCYWCKVMDKQTFPDKAVVDFMNANFVSLKLEMEHNYGVDVAMKYRVRSFPSFLVFSPDGKLVNKFSGYRPAPEFIEELKKSLNKKESPGYAGMSEKVELPFPDFYKKNFGGKGKREFSDSATVNGFLANQSDLYSEVNYSVMVIFSSLLNNKYFLNLVENRAKYEQLYGKGEIEEVVAGQANGKLKSAIKNKSKEELGLVLDFVDKYLIANKEETKEAFRFDYYKGVGDWTMYAKQADNHIATHATGLERINGWAWTIYESCGDLEIVQRAIGWMKPRIDEKPDYASTDTYAALLYKGKQYADAKKYAQKAIELGKAAGEKTEETEALLKKIEAAY